MISSKNIENFNKKFNKLFGEKFTVIGEYTGVNNNILIKSNSCGHEFLVTPTNLFRSKKCTVCSKEKTLKNLRNLYDTKTTDEFVKDVYKKRDDADEYMIVSQYAGASNKITVQHKCGYRFNVRATTFLNDNAKCPLCFKSYMNSELYIKKFNKKYPGDEYTVISNFKSSKEKITIRHNCGHTFHILPSNALNRKASLPLCPACSAKEKHLRFIEKIKNKFDDISYSFELVDFKDAHLHDSIVTVRHKRCGKELDVHLDELFKNRHCKYCSSSIGESIILDFLMKKNINFEYKYRKFKDCVYKAQLEFDFVVFDLNDNVLFIIEFDGEQHKRPFRFNKSKPEKYKDDLQKLELTKIRDTIKNNYCIKNNYKLYRIDYSERKKLESILEKIIEENTISTTIENTSNDGSE